MTCRQHFSIWNAIAVAPSVSRLGRDTLWSTVGNVTMQGLSFCSTLIVVRILTKQEFGQYAVFLSSLALFGTLTDVGLGVAITTTTAELRDAAPAALGGRLAAAYWTGGALSLCLSAIAVVVWAAFGENVIGIKFNALYMILTAATLCVNTASMLQAAELYGYQNFRSLAFAQCSRGIALLPFCVTAAFFFRLPGVITAAAAATGVSAIVQGVALSAERQRRLISVRKLPRWRELRGMLSCSMPAFVNHVANAAGNWGGNVAVALSASTGLAAVAEFGVANQVRTIVLFLPNIIGQVLMPTVANMTASQRRERSTIVRLSVVASTGVAVCLAAVIVAFNRYVVLLFGPTYMQAAATVALIAVGGVIYVAQSTMCYALIGYGHIRWVATGAVVAAIIYVALAAGLIALAPSLGSRSLACAYIIASTAQLVLISAKLRRCLRENIQSERPFGVLAEIMEPSAASCEK